MTKLSLDILGDIDGFLAAALVDSSSGQCVQTIGANIIDLEVAAAGNTEVLLAKRKVAASLQMDDDIEDILISLRKQYHLIRPLLRNPNFFLYLVLDRSRANLAMARHELRTFENQLEFA